jgi:hypothetical protein
VSLSAIGLLSIAVLNAAATTYTGPGTAIGGSPGDGGGISSVVVTNDANNITFTINSSQPMASYIFYTVELQIVGQAGNGSTSLVNPWGENIGISSGVNSLINTYGNGASALTYNSGWTQNASGGYAAGGTGSNFATMTFALSSLGLNIGDTFHFDVASSYASPGGQAAYGALASTGYPAESDNSYQPWLGTNFYDSAADPNSTFNTGATAYTVVPEPCTLVLVGMGGLLLACRRSFRRV